VAGRRRSSSSTTDGRASGRLAAAASTLLGLTVLAGSEGATSRASPVAPVASGVAAADAADDDAAADPAYLRQVLDAVRARRLDQTREWQLLVHYRPTAWGGLRSQADGLGFFLAGPRGQRDPAAELDATVRAFFQSPGRQSPGGQSPGGQSPGRQSPGRLDPETPEGQHPQCVFPARWAWLKRTLPIDAHRLPDRACPLFARWRAGIAAEAATLVYAAAYVNSPASMYGHTFLRLSRATGEGNPLLDYVVNFAADVDTHNGLVYAYRGLTGGFPGRFYVLPFYTKVQEYSNIDSRDLWEYELALSPEQVDRLVMHTWETRTTHFDYLFFTRNCSYELLTLLEVADPRLHLVDGFTGLRVIPSDTVRAVLAQAGLVRRVRPRPSLLTVMTRRKARLASAEVRAAEVLATLPAGAPAPPPGPWSKERQALVIDAAYDYARFREGFHADPSADFKQRERRLLLARGRLGVPPQEVAIRSTIDAPERGHATLRMGVGAGLDDQGGSFETLSLRGAIHDALDPPTGYPRDAVLEMGNIRARFDNQARRLGLDRLDAVHIVSAAPLDRWAHSPSWNIWAGADNARELGCQRPGSDRAGWRCLYGGVSAGGGLAVRLGTDRRTLLFAFLETDAGAGPVFEEGHHVRLGGGGELGFVGDAAERLRMQLGARFMYYFLGQVMAVPRAFVGESISLGREVELRLTADVVRTYAQLTTELFGYL
jgi:hypothetical protein